MMFASPCYWILFRVLMPLGKSNTSNPKLVHELRVGTHTTEKKTILPSRDKNNKSKNAASHFFLITVHKVYILLSFFFFCLIHSTWSHHHQSLELSLKTDDLRLFCHIKATCVNKDSAFVPSVSHDFI